VNVLITSNEYPPYSHGGGLGTHTQLLAEGLSRVGHRVAVISVHHRRACEVKEGGLHLLLYDAREHQGLRISSTQFFASLAEQIATTAPAALDRIGFRPSVVHSQSRQLLDAAESLSRWFNCSLVGQAHISRRHMSRILGAEPDPEFDAGERRLCEIPQRVIFVSEALKTIMCRDFDVPRERARVVRNGVDIHAATARLTKLRRSELRRRFAPAGEKIVVFAGYLSTEKGLFALLNSAQLVLNSGLKVRYLLAGPLADQVRDEFDEIISSDARLASAVQWLGPLKHENAMKLIAAADIFVHPTLFDACSYVALEAMAHGTPVIASDVGGFPEIMEHDVTGHLIPMRNRVPPAIDMDALVERQIALLTDESQAEACAAACIRHVREHFSQDLMIQRTLDCYREVI
jgi:glycogen synthase